MKKSSSFDIPFNRQELADYLSVDRSAMSAELSRMRDEGCLLYTSKLKSTWQGGMEAIICAWRTNWSKSVIGNNWPGFCENFRKTQLSFCGCITMKVTIFQKLRRLPEKVRILLKAGTGERWKSCGISPRRKRLLRIGSRENVKVSGGLPSACLLYTSRFHFQEKNGNQGLWKSDSGTWRNFRSV